MMSRQYYQGPQELIECPCCFTFALDNITRDRCKNVVCMPSQGPELRCLQKTVNNGPCGLCSKQTTELAGIEWFDSFGWVRCHFYCWEKLVTTFLKDHPNTRVNFLKYYFKHY